MTTGPAGGDPIVVLPGNDLCAGFYAGLAAVLARSGFLAHTVTLPGFHGEPPLDSLSWSALIDEVMAKLPLAGSVLAGHSLGGVLALLVAARSPPELRGLVLLEPALSPGRRFAQAAARRYSADVVHGERGRFDNDSGTFRRVHDLDVFDARAIELYLEVRRSSDPRVAASLVAELPTLYPLPFDQVDVPALVLRGARAGAWSRIAALVAARGLADTEVHSIERAAHWMVNEADEAVAARIEAWFSARIGAGGGAPRSGG